MLNDEEKNEIIDLVRERMPDHSHTLDKIQFTDLLGTENMVLDAYATGTLDIFTPADAATPRTCDKMAYTKLKDVSVVRKGVLTAAFNAKYDASDLTAWTEVDPGTHLSESGAVLTMALLNNNETAYLYNDYTADYWSGDFDFRFKINFATIDGEFNFSIFALGNNVEGFKDLQDNLRNFLSVSYYDAGEGDRRLYIQEGVAGDAIYSTTHYDIEDATDYWIRLVRDESVGTYGTLYMYLYTDAFSTLVNTQTLTLHSKVDFRYLFFANSYNYGGNLTISGTIEAAGDQTNVARLYIDGVAKGTEQTLTTSYVNYAENIAVKRGESIQVYAKANNFDTVYVKDFTLKADTYDVPTVILD